MSQILVLTADASVLPHLATLTLLERIQSKEKSEPIVRAPSLDV